LTELDRAISALAPDADALLDPFSTSPIFGDVLSVFCSYRAPYFAFKKRENVYGVVQGCCNHWDCPRCGIMRAKHEYGRIVEGCRTLAKEHDLYFLTITCKGKELAKHEADANYLKWTNKLLDALRVNAKASGQFWAYVQVTERQSRGHPHSHILTVWRPQDLQTGTKRQYITTNEGKRKCQNVPVLRSEYLQKRVIASGLGEQYDISKVDTVEGASRYVAKYLFKPEMFTDKFPPHWKRIRYSQSFPQLPERETDAFILLSGNDWNKLASLSVVVQVADAESLSEANYWLKNTGVIIRPMKPDRAGTMLIS